MMSPLLSYAVTTTLILYGVAILLALSRVCCEVRESPIHTACLQGVQDDVQSVCAEQACHPR